jgi:hypothetical protein
MDILTSQDMVSALHVLDILGNHQA